MKITKKVIVDGKEINDTENESKYALVEVWLNLLRTASNYTTLISVIANIINKENLIIAQGEGKLPVSI